MLIHRHASAGARLDSPDLDRLRPLDRTGRDDARRLAAVLAQRAITRILTSPARRCVDSVRPLAAVRGLELELCDGLLPDAELTATQALLRELPPTALVCTHREVIERLFDGAVRCEKGGTWVVERRRSRLVPVEYLAPPTTLERERRLGVVARSSSA
jgi:phosphohistidine phosphatase SixA